MSQQRNWGLDDVLFHHGHRWFYEKADLEQGAYCLLDPKMQKMAVILPHDRTLPIDHPGKNAALYTRRHDSKEWHHSGTYSLDEALTRGCAHADRYRDQQMRASIDFFKGAKSEPSETWKKLRNGAEKAAYTIATGGLLEDDNLHEAIANFAEGISQVSGKSQKYHEKQIRKYLKERSWEREEGRER